MSTETELKIPQLIELGAARAETNSPDGGPQIEDDLGNRFEPV